MAAISIANSQRTLSVMSSRRVPLTNNPNAANSPYRNVPGAASKQKRSYATIQREEAYGQPPPTKKQMLESNHSSLRTPPRQSAAQLAEGRVFTRRSNVSQLTTLDRKLEAARVKTAQPTASKADKASEENLETIRLWQKHYRKVFPKCVFYFESIPEEVRIKYAKQVTALGAREEKFFSNAVTHVVTTRQIPPERESSSVDTMVDASTSDSHSQPNHPQTINPLLLDRSSESAANQLDAHALKSRFTFDITVGRKGPSATQDIDLRRQHGRNADVLHRARELGMKIWALEKLQRMMVTLFDTDTGLQIHGHNTRSNAIQGNVTNAPRAPRDADLSLLLRNERINGPSDRDPTVASKEMILFKGPFIYVHDIDEKQKPIMVREYGKVSRKEDGEWPQFRSVANGKCPFVMDVDYNRREAEKEMARQEKGRHQERETSAPRTRAAAAEEVARMQPPKSVQGNRPLTDGCHTANRGADFTVSKKSHHFDRPQIPVQVYDGELTSKDSQSGVVARAEARLFLGNEPVASGLQPSNITSAIRSQMISSTAAAPGTKAGTSKEVHGLQRKVLERNSGPPSLGLASSHRMTDISAAIKEDLTSKPSTIKGQEHLAFIEEEFSANEAEENARHLEAARRAKASHKKKVAKKDPKPGYCENCVEKFDDFDEHVTSRKHRKFAEKNENWRELDALLSQLIRPLIDDDCY